MSKNEAVSVRALADILVDKEGRAFVLGLDRKHTDHCIDVLDHVSRHLRLQPSLASSPYTKGKTNWANIKAHGFIIQGVGENPFRRAPLRSHVEQGACSVEQGACNVYSILHKATLDLT